MSGAWRRGFRNHQNAPEREVLGKTHKKHKKGACGAGLPGGFFPPAKMRPSTKCWETYSCKFAQLGAMRNLASQAFSQA
jgi:hypothetical protein